MLKDRFVFGKLAKFSGDATSFFSGIKDEISYIVENRINKILSKKYVSVIALKKLENRVSDLENQVEKLEKTQKTNKRKRTVLKKKTKKA